MDNLLCQRLALRRVVGWASWRLLAEIAGLQGKRDELTASLAGLEKAGALAKLNRCGPAPGRLCIRVNDVAGPFTSGPDTYRVIQGY